MEEAHITHMMQYSFVGSKETVGKKLAQFIKETAIDELIVVSHIFEHEKRLRSFELLSEME